MATTKLAPLQGMMLFAKSKKRVSTFYQRVLGLKAVESEVSHDLLRGGGYEIIVHALPRKVAAGIEITRPPRPREHAAIKPTFVVESLDNVRRAAKKNWWQPPASVRGMVLSRVHGARRHGPGGQSTSVQATGRLTRHCSGG